MTTKITEKNISSLANAGVQWQAVIVADGSTGTTGVAGRGFFINTTSAAHTFTLPAIATFADTILIKDYAGTFGTNKLTIARNGHNIQGAANNSLIGTNRASVTLVYVDVTRGWEFVTESNVADLQAASFISATGGTITTSGNFKIHSFTGDGCFVVATVGNPAGGPSNVDYLVVAGGGGGGKNHGGGGGAGGFREGRVLPAPESYTASPLVAPAGLPVSATTYPVTVGAGGTAPSAAPIGGGPYGTQGSSSIFSTITSAGGGVGADESANNNGPVRIGGSGGGGTYSPSPGDNPGAAGNTPPVSPPQGNPGGQGGTYAPGSASTGGGGGATVAGATGTGPISGAGGNGATTSISDSSTTYAGGGGGGATVYGAPSPAPGGTGGGGAGSASPTGTGTAGTGNTGGGGGGGKGGPGTGAGGAGGKGIVVIRYKFQ